MTAAEKLEKAKNGDEYAYRLLCGDAADRLYAVALLTLGRGDDAEKAVLGAFNDGYSAVSRIKDEAHLRAWLSRELTKHLVALIKEYRAKGITLVPTDEFSRLPSLDRIICALALAFGYSSREIAVISGMSEETVQRKLAESERKLGKSRDDVIARIEGCKAPDTLKTEEKPPVCEADIYIGEESPVYEDDISEEPAYEADMYAEEEPPAYDTEEKPSAYEPEAYTEEASAYDEDGQMEDAPSVYDDLLLEEPEPEEVTAEPEKTEEKYGERETRERESVFAAEHKADTGEIDARTFIGVITSQKIKGKEFLQLMGNTRISNSIYREIEQNPNLTKGRLIELLESSSLTSEDYYKMLSAVKQRSELISRKQKNDSIKAEAGLFILDKKSGGQQQSDAIPFKPVVNTAVLENLSGYDTDADEPEERGKSAHRRPGPAQQARPRTAGYRPDEPLYDDDERRERYKGKEYFIDDDTYYKGVNNGKMIFCAICAVLLFAGSFGIRYLKTGSLLPTDRVYAEQPAPGEEEPDISEITSDGELLAAAAKMKSRVQHSRTGYYRTDATPYTEELTQDYCGTEDMLYIKDGSVLRAAALTDEPYIAAELSLSEGLVGFTAVGERVYIVYSAQSENGGYAAVETYDKLLGSSERYEQDGQLVTFRAGDSAFTLITSLEASGKHTSLPSYTLGGEKKTAGYELFRLADGAVCGGMTVIGTVSGGEARINAVLGGYSSYASFDGDRLTLILPDWNNTHIEKYRLIGIAAELVSSETVPGECLSAQCLDSAGDRAVVYDSGRGCYSVIKRNGEGFAASDSFAEGEILKGVSFTDSRAYVITGRDGDSMLYCADTSGEIPVPAEAETDEVYTEKLAGFGGGLIGLAAEADENGERTGLRLTVYGYENGLTAQRSALITVDENTAGEYARYLSGDAEENPLRIAVNKEGTKAAVSCVYFDGVSEIERFLCFSDNGGTLEKTTDHLLYDARSAYRYCTLRGDKLYVVTDKGIYTIN